VTKYQTKTYPCIIYAHCYAPTVNFIEHTINKNRVTIVVYTKGECGLIQSQSKLACVPYGQLHNAPLIKEYVIIDLPHDFVNPVIKEFSNTPTQLIYMISGQVDTHPNVRITSSINQLVLPASSDHMKNQSAGSMASINQSELWKKIPEDISPSKHFDWIKLGQKMGPLKPKDSKKYMNDCLVTFLFISMLRTVFAV
jgi:hypothetical protein